MLETVRSFFWILFFEFPLNFIPLAGFMLALKGAKDKQKILTHVYCFVAAALSVFFIAFLEPWKVSVTTLGAPAPLVERMPFIVIGTFVFYLFFWLFTKYFTAPWSNKEFDAKLGILVAIIVSFLEVIMLILDGSADTMPWLRILTHTFAQMLAFPLALIGLRLISKKEGLMQFIYIFGIALLMSVAITFLDYMPFVK